MSRVDVSKDLKEGAKVVIPYYNEHRDAHETKEYIEMLGGECELLAGDISDKKFCKYIRKERKNEFLQRITENLFPR